MSGSPARASRRRRRWRREPCAAPLKAARPSTCYLRRRGRRPSLKPPGSRFPLIKNSWCRHSPLFLTHIGRASLRGASERSDLEFSPSGGPRQLPVDRSSLDSWRSSCSGGAGEDVRAVRVGEGGRACGFSPACFVDVACRFAVAVVSPTRPSHGAGAVCLGRHARGVTRVRGRSRGRDRLWRRADGGVDSWTAGSGRT